MIETDDVSAVSANGRGSCLKMVPNDDEARLTSLRPA